VKEQFKQYINRYVTFTDAEVDKIYNEFQLRTFDKKKYLLQQGEICKHNYFILSGLTRSFYISPKGNEKITLFAVDNWWITNTESFVKETPSQIYIQAIENTAVLAIDKLSLEKLYGANPKIERLFRILNENMLIAVQRKYDVYLQMKSKERYYNFIKSLPNFVQRVPQYMIASYLEITPEYLSELRKN